jgi:hypothetical protein
MARIALSPKAAKLMKLCELESYKRFYDLLKACTADSVCPAICMTEGSIRIRQIAVVCDKWFKYPSSAGSPQPFASRSASKQSKS